MMPALPKTIAVLAGAAVVAAGLVAADSATTKKSTTAPAKKSTTKSSVTHKSTTQKKAPAHKTVASTKKRGPSSKRPVQSWRARQTQPTPDRYREIQQALVNKGYLSGTPSGTWDQQSVDALRRFQQDQKLESTGKIDSLSLIALGLGPRHETAAAHPPAPTPPAN